MAKAAKKAATKKAGGKAAKYLGVVGRKDMSSADPDELVIVDTPGHPLYQPARNTKPLEEWMVLSIMAHGVIQPIKVVRGPMVAGRWSLEVIFGRQRVRHAREANRRLLAAGLPTIMLEIVIVHGTPEQLRAMVEVENTHRTDYTPYELATTAAESLQRGASEEAVCNRSFKGSKTAMRRHLDLLRCAPEVQRAVIEGDLNFKAIDSLVKLSLPDQVLEVDKLREAGLSGPREVRARLITDHPEVEVEVDGDDEGDEEGVAEGDEEEAGDDDSDSDPKIKIRRAQVLRDRLAVLEGLPPLAFETAARAVRLARIAEIKWVLGDDDALVGVAMEELGPWGSQRSAAQAKAAAAAEKQAAKQAKADEKQAAKQAKEAAKQAKEAAKQAKARQSEEDARQISLDAALPTNKRGSRSKK